MEKDVLYVVANPTSGSGRGRRVWQQVKAELEAEGRAYSMVTDTLPPSGSTVMLIGGDGTYCCFVNRTDHPEQYRYILVEAGSSNSLWTTFGRELSVERLALRAGEGSLAFREMDLGQVVTENGAYWFWNEASLGFAAAIGARTVDSRLKRVMNRLRWSELSYILTAFEVWWHEQPVMINLMNNNRISGDLRPCPDAHPDDGVLEVSELRCPRWRLPIELARMIGLETENTSRLVRLHKGEIWETILTNPLPLETDGEPREAARQIQYTLPTRVSVQFWNINR